METGQYVNEPSYRRNQEKKRGGCPSGGSNVYKVVGVSFGLLCIIQSILNVSLRLQAGGLSNRADNISTSNSTLASADDLRALMLERDQLNRDKEQLQVTNRNLTEEWHKLNQRVEEQQNQIQELQATVVMAEQNAPQCPWGWWPYQSSCYQLSSTRNTWDYARRDCEGKGARLVILNSVMEEEFVILLLRAVYVVGDVVKMWIGLENLSRWGWLDARPLSFADTENLRLTGLSSLAPSCAYIDCNGSVQKTWFRHTCAKRHYWMCEMELPIISTN